MLFVRLRLACAFAPVFASASEVPTQAIALYNGQDLGGWELVTSEKESLSQACHVQADGILRLEGKLTGYLATRTAYENYQLHVEWRWLDKPGNAGVLVHISEGPTDRIWPICFQIQTKHLRVGDVLPMSTATFGEQPTSGANPPQLVRQGNDSEKPVGEWNTCDIVCRRTTIEITINGVAQNRVTNCQPASGKIGFQLEGVAYELRNVRIAPLKPAIGSGFQDAERVSR